ncbi:MAG: polyprenyl synthetase family protein [Erysipelothrix sp.]|jgi:geranylgeranyl diphosphate synthase type II|nr:polyprenyl synthetase family protein [Erysipelothrix sp.]
MKLHELIKAAFEHDADSTIKEAMLYSLGGKSKQLRSQLILAMLEDYGVEAMFGYPSAIALEMIQTYSLIHDDLPAMDDDGWRRNQLSNHKQYDEATAILAGDGLLTKAMEVIVTSEYDAALKVAILNELTLASGINGMILGQHYDMQAHHLKHNNDVLKMYSLKTGMLFGAALAIGAHLSNQGYLVDNYRTIGQSLGVAFQIQDDLFDLDKSEAQLGKSKSDMENEKITIVTLSGRKAAIYLMTNTLNDVIESLKRMHQHDYVLTLIESIKQRGY